MSGITTGIGLFSGIDTGSLIQQLLSIEARPRDLAQRRILQLQIQQSAYLDINSRMSALRTAAKEFRTNFTFESMGATSSDASVLSAEASRNATPGSYTFIVDRLVSAQQLLSRGFVDKDSTGLNAESFTFESAEGRLDRDLALADLNNGDGVRRGKLVITQGSNSETIDLSKAVTVNDVLDAINASSLDVSASVEGGSFRITGGSDFTIADGSGYTTATSLGIQTSTPTSDLTGDTVYELGSATTLTQLNDGNGVFIDNDVGESRHDFKISIGGGSAVEVNIGSVWETIDDELVETSSAVSSISGVLDRINTALSDAGFSEVTAAVADGSIVFTDTLSRTIDVTEESTSSTTARDLGILGSGTGTLTGRQVLAGLNTTLVSNLNGGSGIAGDGTISFTTHDTSSVVVDVSGAATINEVISEINSQSGGSVTASLNPTGNGLMITDNTSGASNLIITGDTADSLGISTDVTGTAETSVEGTSVQHKYFSTATRVEDLAGGEGIGTGTFRITDGDGISFNVEIGSDTETVYDLLKEINGQASAAGANILVRVNDNGDGLLIEEDDANPDGASAIKVEDVTGTVADALRIKGEATGTGDDNYLDGSAEVTVEFDATDTLQNIVTKINDAGAGVSATIINDGTGSNPYRLNITSKATGTDGRFIVDDGGLGLDLTTLDDGQDAVAFYGSTDPAAAVLLTSSSNTLDGVVQGVTIDLNKASEDPVTVTVSRATDKIISAVGKFVEAYNGLVDRIQRASRYDAETETKGPLLGDSTLITMRSALQRTILSEPVGVDDQFSRVTQVGIEFTDGGKISLDREKLREAMETDFTAVADLLAARELIPPDAEEEIADGVFVRNSGGDKQFSKLGILFMFEELGDDYLDSVDGILTYKEDTLEDQISLQEKRIENFNVLLEIRREKLQAQFLAMEQALAALQNQQSALAGLTQLAG